MGNDFIRAEHTVDVPFLISTQSILLFRKFNICS